MVVPAFKPVAGVQRMRHPHGVPGRPRWGPPRGQPSASIRMRMELAPLSVLIAGPEGMALTGSGGAPLQSALSVRQARKTHIPPS